MQRKSSPVVSKQDLGWET